VRDNIRKTVIATLLFKDTKRPSQVKLSLGLTGRFSTSQNIGGVLSAASRADLIAQTVAKGNLTRRIKTMLWRTIYFGVGPYT
jgi:hypothetical protein